MLKTILLCTNYPLIKNCWSPTVFYSVLTGVLLIGNIMIISHAKLANQYGKEKIGLIFTILSGIILIGGVATIRILLS